MKTYVFTPRDTDTVDDWKNEFNKMYGSREEVTMIVDLTNYSQFDLKKMICLKMILDFYKPATRAFLRETHIKISDPLLKTFVRGCLDFFQPEKPVKFI